MADELTPLPFLIKGDQPDLDAQAVLIEARNVVSGDMTIDFVETPKEPKLGAVAIRGRLLGPSEELFPRWLKEFNRRGYTPFLQPDSEAIIPGNVVLRVMPGVVRPTESNPWINLLLFVATVFSTLFIGAGYTSEPMPPGSTFFELLITGWPFTVTILLILSAHEFGHYFAARYHKVAVSLPYFIPLPVGFGTMGAVIRMKEPIPDRRKLFDIGVAGPIAGLVLAIPLLFIGLSTSPLITIEPDAQGMLEGNSILYYFAKFTIFGQGLPNWETGADVLMNRVTYGAWIGLLVTAFNLLPVGQLDGGHTVFALLGRRARHVNNAVLLIMAASGILGLLNIWLEISIIDRIAWSGWLVWLALIYSLIGPYHPPALDDVTELDQRRRWIGYLVIAIFILTFTPVPMRPL